MPLKLSLKPGEKFVLNGAVLANGDKRTSLVIQNKACVLREKDIMQPESANTPARRIEAVRKLTDAGIPTGVIVAPIVPALTDFDIERVLSTASEAGATYAGYVMLRLPSEVHDVFVDWLEANYPMRARHVMSLIEQVRDGKHNSAEFGKRMTGTGLHAELIRQRFHLAARKLGLNQARPPLRTDQFKVPPPASPAVHADSRANPQMPLF